MTNIPCLSVSVLCFSWSINRQINCVVILSDQTHTQIRQQPRHAIT